MKAELMINGFCVHKLKKDIAGFKDLYRQQFKEPIHLKSIAEIISFEVDKKNRVISHKALTIATIGINVLLNRKEYSKFYTFDESLLTFIKSINSHRNKIHFVDSIEFSMSLEFIQQLELIDKFITEIFHNRKFADEENDGGYQGEDLILSRWSQFGFPRNSLH